MYLTIDTFDLLGTNMPNYNWWVVLIWSFGAMRSQRLAHSTVILICPINSWLDALMEDLYMNGEVSNITTPIPKMFLLQQQHLILKVIMVVDHPIMRIFVVMLFGVNLEYLGRVVFYTNGILYPDSVVGTDSHTTMIAGLGVAGWGVGGIESEATMLGQTCMKWVAVFSSFSSKGAKENVAFASPKPAAAGDSNCNVLEGLRVDSWRSGDSIAWTSRAFI